MDYNILNLDNIESLNDSVEKNFETMIKKYGILFTKIYNNTPKKSLFSYIMKIISQNKELHILINKEIKPLTKKCIYNLHTLNIDKNIDKDKNDDKYIDSLYGISINYNENDSKYIKKNDIVIGTISKNPKQNISSGSQAILTAIDICKYLNAEYVFLMDSSYITCDDKDNINKYKTNISLKLYKLLTTNKTWYEKYGFKLNISNEQQKDFDKIVSRVQKIKMSDILKTLKKIKSVLFSKSLKKNESNNNIIIWKNNKPSVKIKFDSNKNMSNKYKKIKKTIQKLINNIEENSKLKDTIKSFSKRMVDDNKKCYIYKNVIENFIINGDNVFIKNKNTIKIPYINDIITMKNVMKTYEPFIYYKKKL